MPVDQVLDLYERDLVRTRFVGDAWPKWWPNFGPGIMAGFVGARVRSVPTTVWFEPSGAVPLAAVLEHPELFVDHRVGLIISGGNMDLDHLPW